MKHLFSNRDIEFMKNTILKAGDKALEIQKHGLQVNRKNDKTIVTQADLLIQDMLISAFSDRFKDVNFLYEEDFSTDEFIYDEHRLSIIIDPIDGTAMYSMYLPIWCVSVGIFEGHTPRYGFVYSPGCDMFFHNDDEHAYINDDVKMVQKSQTIDSETNVFYSSEIQGIYGIDFPGKVRNIGSTAIHACLTIDNARNRTLAFIGKCNIWDWAGALPIIERAGGNVLYINGEEVDYKRIFTGDFSFRDYILVYNSDDFNYVRSIFIDLL